MYHKMQTRLFVVGVLSPSLVSSLATRYVATIEHQYKSVEDLLSFGKETMMNADYNSLLIADGVPAEARQKIIGAVTKVRNSRGQEVPAIAVITDSQNFDDTWQKLPLNPTVGDVASVFRIPPRTSPARVVVVASTKGGVGKSGIATSLAVMLSRTKKPDGSAFKVALIDDDRMTRSVRIVMGVEKGPSTAKLVQTVAAGQGIVTPKIIEEHLVLAHGVYCLVGPDTVITKYPIDLELARDVLSIMGIELGFDFIVIDAPPDFLQASNFTYSTLDSSANMPVPPLILVPVVPEKALLNSAMDTLQVVKHFQIPADRAWPVVNCINPNHVASDLEDSKLLWTDPMAILPYMSMARFVGENQRPVVCEPDGSKFNRWWRSFFYGESSVLDMKNAYNGLIRKILTDTESVKGTHRD
jgi:Mrp family chromosome partitioning ATPase